MYYSERLEFGNGDMAIIDYADPNSPDEMYRYIYYEEIIVKINSTFRVGVIYTKDEFESIRIELEERERFRFYDALEWLIDHEYIDKFEDWIEDGQGKEVYVCAYTILKPLDFQFDFDLE